jgi:hypothetical protein
VNFSLLFGTLVANPPPPPDNASTSMLDVFTFGMGCGFY